MAKSNTSGIVIGAGLIALWFLTGDCCKHVMTPAIDRPIRFPEQPKRPTQSGGSHTTPSSQPPHQPQHQDSWLDSIGKGLANLRHGIAVGTHTPDLTPTIGERPIIAEGYGYFDDDDYDDYY